MTRLSANLALFYRCSKDKLQLKKNKEEAEKKTSNEAPEIAHQSRLQTVIQSTGNIQNDAQGSNEGVFWGRGRLGGGCKW